MRSLLEEMVGSVRKAVLKLVNYLAVQCSVISKIAIAIVVVVVCAFPITFSSFSRRILRFK